MSNSTDSDSVLTVTKRQTKFTPPGYDIVLTETQTEQLLEIMAAPGWNVLKNVVVFQRKDHIARKALATANSIDQLQYFRGMAAELQTLMVTMKNLKKEAQKHIDKELDNGLDGKETVKDYS